MRVNIRAQVLAGPLTGRARVLARCEDVPSFIDVFRSLDRQKRSASGTMDRGDAIPPSAGSGTCLATALPAAHFDRNESHVIYGTGH